MATQKTELFESRSGLSSQLRVEALTIQPRKFATGSGTLAQLTPVAFNTSTLKYVPWDQDGSNGTNVIEGFVWPDAIVLDGSDEVLGNVLLGGKLHFDDLPAATDVDANATAAGWNAALRAAKTFGLYVEGVPADV